MSSNYLRYQLKISSLEMYLHLVLNRILNTKNEGENTYFNYAYHILRFWPVVTISIINYRFWVENKFTFTPKNVSNIGWQNPSIMKDCYRLSLNDENWYQMSSFDYQILRIFCKKFTLMKKNSFKKYDSSNPSKFGLIITPFIY